MTSQKQRISARVKAARAAASLTQQQLANLAGVSIATVARLESGRTAHPREDEFERIATALGTTTDTLMGIDDGDTDTPNDDLSMIEVQRKLAEITGDRRVSVSFLRAAQNRDRIPKSAWALIELALQAANDSIPEQREDDQATTE